MAAEPFAGEAGLARILAAMQIETDGDGPTIEELEQAMAEVPDRVIMMMDDFEVLHFLAKFADRSTLFWRTMLGDINTPYTPQGVVQ